MYIASGGQTKRSRNEIGKVSSTNVIPAGGNITWPVAVVLPQGTPPTTLRMCKMIAIEYHLEVHENILPMNKPFKKLSKLSEDE